MRLASKNSLLTSKHLKGDKYAPVFTARDFLVRLSHREGFVGGCIFGSSARGNPEFHDVDLFVLSEKPLELPVRMDRVEIHAFLVSELERVDRKFLYGVWRDENFGLGDLSLLERVLKNSLSEWGVKVELMKVKKAWFGIEDAKRHMKLASEASDADRKDYHVREACEHAFHAIVVATEELFIRYGYPIPSDHTERFNFLAELAAEDVKIKKLKLKERLGKAFEILHVKGYYHGTYELKEIVKRIKSAEEYVKDVEQLLKVPKAKN